MSDDKIIINLDLISNAGSKSLIVLPFLLLIGILYQTISLLTVDKLGFFSWSQVINDTVSLFLPLLCGMAGIFVGNLIRVAKGKDFLMDLFTCTIVFITLCALLLLTKIKILNEILLIGYVATVGWEILIFLQLLIGSEKLKNDSYRNNLSYIFIFATVIFILYHLRGLQYNNIHIKVAEKEEKVIYMNDEYIILQNNVIHNQDGIVFFTKK